MTKTHLLCGLGVAAIACLAVIDPALAQTTSTDWATPATSGITSFTTQIVSVSSALIGLAIVVFGAWSAMNHRIKWETFWVLFLAGMIIAVGPSAFAYLMSKFNSSLGTGA